MGIRQSGPCPGENTIKHRLACAYQIPCFPQLTPVKRMILLKQRDYFGEIHHLIARIIPN